MKRLTAEETLTYLINLLCFYLEELQRYDKWGKNTFIYGEKTAYVECLEVVQRWEGAKKVGLDYNIEARFPLL